MPNIPPILPSTPFAGGESHSLDLGDCARAHPESTIIVRGFMVTHMEVSRNQNPTRLRNGQDMLERQADISLPEDARYYAFNVLIALPHCWEVHLLFDGAHHLTSGPN